ncbi:hypothetical protein NQ315_008363 [Exocentrus adspersus]|uniref:CCHC-type domain-containing protein n=1 Tax=Exocentrus adspersus TaxID=1586481 RepID=A0AAV8VRN0_9CUCU|nr:hypothetical protein NQ315_008363 [Exocentrus adspersus]
MSSQIERKRRSRAVARASVTRGFTEMDQLLQSESVDEDQVAACFRLLESRFKELEVVDSEIYEIMLDDSTEEELNKEVEGCEVYKRKFVNFGVKFDKLRDSWARKQKNLEGASEQRGESASTGKRKFKLPKIEFKCYDGDVKGWLSFWAQFRKIHEDEDIDDNDKIEYLIQATTSGSRARRLVESFPAMAENYGKIVDSMHARFGREDLLIEVYVRELLKLILSNAAAPNKVEISVLYDKIETQLRALDMLGVTSEKCSAMLYPLIESCLPQDLLRVWQRSTPASEALKRTSSQTSVASAVDEVKLESRLQGLMNFLKAEVENEQRICLAAEGFGLRTAESTETNGKRKQSKVGSAIPTATGLVNCDSQCVFCNAGHESNSCHKARKLTLADKKKVLKEKNACYRCLKVGHQFRKCHSSIRCIICNKWHAAMVCPELPANKRDINTEPTEIEPRTQDQVLANHTGSHVFLQTLSILLKCKTGFCKVRALIDTGSHRSYILKSTAVKLGYKPKRTENLLHCLFGGVQKMTNHNCYDITIVGNDYSCHFEAMDQAAICNELPPVFDGPWTAELRSRGIIVTDAGSTGPIEILIGADAAGKLYTGTVHALSCGLLAVETKLGWTIMGKADLRGGTVAMNTISLLVNDTSIARLWELEVLGIAEPAAKQSREEMEAAAKQLFMETAKVNDEGRYEVCLPWLEGHPPLKTNYKLAQNRLDSTLRKLKKDELVDSYGAVFQEWLAEGVIERIEESSLEVQGHYLPHRPVIKESSLTTKIRPVFDASAHEKDGISLNQCLEKGPNLIELIPSILLRFRENPVGVVADIRKAFLQISLSESDRNFLKFLWIDSEEKVVTYRHKRVVFGVNCSPFLLGATIEHHLSECRKRCENGKMGYSLDTVDKLANSFYVDNCVTSVADRHTLQRFRKEAEIIMQEAKFDLRGWESSEDTNQNSAVVPVLGLLWHLGTDTLSISEECLKNNPKLDNSLMTKRIILSMAQRVFDVIGFTCPATLVPKLLLQKAWEKNLRWDEPAGEEIAKPFREWLELDSSTIISWIQRKEEWNTFVGNRVSEIRKLTDPDKWQHIPGDQNPADLPSRGCSPRQLLESKWWEGPKWLYEEPYMWPRGKLDCNEDEIAQERKKGVTAILMDSNTDFWHLSHFSSYLKTVRMIAWVFRFVYNSRKCNPKRRGELTVEEIEYGENFLLKLIQVQQIVWRFNPPSAPWWGGFWERLVGILKQLLRKVLGRASLNYEELLTVLCDCEAVINARPLTHVSDDPKDLIAITPAMFLADQTEYGLPDCDSVERASLCRKLRYKQKLRDDLRRRFRSEYLGQLKSFSESGSRRTEIKLGDIVLIGDDHTKRMDWPLARVVEILPGKDQRIRLVKVETAKGQLLRPVQRLYCLECVDASALNQEESESAGVSGNKSKVPENECAEVSGNKSRVPVVTRSGRVSVPPSRGRRGKESGEGDDIGDLAARIERIREGKMDVEINKGYKDVDWQKAWTFVTFRSFFTNFKAEYRQPRLSQ